MKKLIITLCLLPILTFATICDNLAGNPLDENRKSKGVSFKNLKANKAIKACKAEYAKDPTNLRIMYQLSRSYDKANNAKKAVLYSEKSCDGGYAIACNGLGLLSYQGKFLEENEPLALYYFLQACRKGNAGGCYNAAGLYEYGKGTKIKLQKAKYYYDKACTEGYKDGCRKVKTF